MRIVSSPPNRSRPARKRGTGCVTLVGAGPGDPELLTLKALRVLQEADVILFDDLVSDEILDLARKETRRMLVGKRGGRKSCRQEDINDAMIALARAGNRVVRLKSGDPTIFGRAGEEVAALEREGIPVAIVPGITSALAMAAELGVSLTHRDHAQSVRFVTAHNRDGELPDDVDWRGAAHPRTTTIFYMGGRMATRLAERLLAEGAKETTPVSVVVSLTRPNETHWHGTLRQLASGAAALDVSLPIIIGVGEVFSKARQSKPTSIDLSIAG